MIFCRVQIQRNITCNSADPTSEWILQESAIVQLHICVWFALIRWKLQEMRQNTKVNFCARGNHIVYILPCPTCVAPSGGPQRFADPSSLFRKIVAPLCGIRLSLTLPPFDEKFIARSCALRRFADPPTLLRKVRAAQERAAVFVKATEGHQKAVGCTKVRM